MWGFENLLAGGVRVLELICEMKDLRKVPSKPHWSEVGSARCAVVVHIHGSSHALGID